MKIMEQNLTFNDLNRILQTLSNEHDISYSDWMCEDISPDGIPDELKGELGEFEFTDHYGGEGQGDDYYTIVYFKKYDIYIKFAGWYASHYGSEYTNHYQVYPGQVTVTEWFKSPITS